MTISKDLVLQLSKDSLPKIIEHHLETDQGNGITTYTEDDVATAVSSMNTDNIQNVHQLCRLWAGKGSIYKISLQNVMNNANDHRRGYNKTKDAATTTHKTCYDFVIKYIHSSPPSKTLSIGDRRKADSYIVEANFYRNLATSLREEPYHLALPQPYLVEIDGSKKKKGDIIICMSYLDGQDWYSSITSNAMYLALDWLATFHASHWDSKHGADHLDRLVTDVGLQRMGSYWHLDTRPDEHSSMMQRGWEGRLKRAARAIDDCLRRDPMQCLIHGDPKAANIMLLKQSSSSRSDPAATVTAAGNTAPSSPRAAFYDFQYCGKGSPTRDLAYFLCTSCDEQDEADLVGYYHRRMVEHLHQKQKSSSDSVVFIPTLEHLNDSMLIAYADLCRFMAGWGYWGFDVKDRIRGLLDRLDGGMDLGSEDSYQEAVRREFW
jgi:hypothetical protein